LQVAKFLSLNSPSLPPLQPISDKIKKKRSDLIKYITTLLGKVPQSYSECILNGVAFHNAGLLLEEREAIEKAACENGINILVATTTLSAGVNIHSVHLVIVHNIFRCVPKGPPIPIQKSQFIQMIGRAGRTETIHGKAYIVEQTGNEKEVQAIRELILTPLDNLNTRFLEGNNPGRYVIQGIAAGLFEKIQDIHNFFSISFSLFQIPERAVDLSNQCIDRLSQLNLIQKDCNIVTITQRGEAIAWSQISIEDSEFLSDAIKRIEHQVCLNDEIRLLF
jgi:DNA polymerase theta